MKEEKNELQTGVSTGGYTAPNVKAVEIMSRSVICASDQNALLGGFSNGEQEGY